MANGVSSRHCVSTSPITPIARMGSFPLKPALPRPARISLSLPHSLSKLESFPESPESSEFSCQIFCTRSFCTAVDCRNRLLNTGIGQIEAPLFCRQIFFAPPKKNLQQRRPCEHFVLAGCAQCFGKDTDERNCWHGMCCGNGEQQGGCWPEVKVVCQATRWLSALHPVHR